MFIPIIVCIFPLSNPGIVLFAHFLLLEIKTVVVHFQGKAFNSICLLSYQLADVGGGPTHKGT
jgi:hypothetical protein